MWECGNTRFLKCIVSYVIISCDMRNASCTNTYPTHNALQIPQPRWMLIVSIGSSIFNLNNIVRQPTNANAPTTNNYQRKKNLIDTRIGLSKIQPITIAIHGSMRAADDVIDTKPDNNPYIHITRSYLYDWYRLQRNKVRCWFRRNSSTWNMLHVHTGATQSLPFLWKHILW